MKVSYANNQLRSSVQYLIHPNVDRIKANQVKFRKVNNNELKQVKSTYEANVQKKQEEEDKMIKILKEQQKYLKEKVLQGKEIKPRYSPLSRVEKSYRLHENSILKDASFEIEQRNKDLVEYMNSQKVPTTIMIEESEPVFKSKRDENIQYIGKDRLEIIKNRSKVNKIDKDKLRLEQIRRLRADLFAQLDRLSQEERLILAKNKY